MAEVATLSENIAAYEEMQAQLEAERWGEFAVFYDRVFRGTFKDFRDAVEFAIGRWDRGPFLVREVGRPRIVDAPMIQYHASYAKRLISIRQSRIR